MIPVPVDERFFWKFMMCFLPGPLPCGFSFTSDSFPQIGRLQHRPRNTGILIRGTPQKVPLIWGPPCSACIGGPVGQKTALFRVKG